MTMSKEAVDYRSLQAALDAVLSDLQRDDIDIDQATQLYEKGLGLVKDIQAYLSQAENQISKLKADFDKAA